MYVDYKLLSRDLKKSVSVEEALVDVTQQHCVAPMHWLEGLRSPSQRLPKGFYREQKVYVPPPGTKPGTRGEPNAVQAGPLIMNIVGQMTPVIVNVNFVDEVSWGMKDPEDCDLRVGLEAIEQCTLFNELRPGGLLTETPISELKNYGMVCGLSESPLVRRPWTKMKYMFIDELQRGPPLQEYIGHNPRVGVPWRFSQHCKHFRIGVWRELTRKTEMHEGLHLHSSWQKSPQQSVPEVRFLAPGP